MGIRLPRVGNRGADTWRKNLVRIGVAATLLVTPVLIPSAAHAACPPEGWYANITNLGDEHVHVGPNFYVRNENPGTIPASFTSNHSGSVSVSASYSGSISGGVDLVVVNASVSQTFGISVSYTLTTSVGVTAGPMNVPSGKIQWANYGVGVRKSKGTFGRVYSNCSSKSVSVTLAKSPRGIGWRLWQTWI